MNDMSPSHVLIIGAGLGGPAMALALARHGIRSTLYERRASCQDLGGILSLAPNAVRVLDKIVGVESEVRQLGSTFNGFNLYLDIGNEDAAHMGNMGNFQRTGYDGISIKRPVLHNKLVDLCKENEMIGLEYNRRLTGIKEDEKGVTAMFEGGTQARGELFITPSHVHIWTLQWRGRSALRSHPNPEYT
jgi:2-polyprenyl-6-methoxyphenol hydroxylase-like FAD-dependent oxidoreductase